MTPITPFTRAARLIRMASSTSTTTATRTFTSSLNIARSARLASRFSAGSVLSSYTPSRQLAAFSTSAVWHHGAMPRPAPGQGIKVNFITREGETVTVEANEGESLLDVARANDLDVEGACEASLACSTCHLILDDKSFSKLEEPSDEENDMLDLAFGLSDTSRLGCQVLMTKELAGLTAKIPSATRNMYVDGAKPKHH
ncbi:hypothetical protein BGZ93_008169 [Podila epicladia]|nr:hypothetical protein BGZ92_008444 [Podila epicladia]KAG0092803.1 hypothetical protein BGZ93_008169 [Podila epicladia]